MQAHWVADALKKVPGMLNQDHTKNIKVAFEVFLSFLELVGGKDENSCKMPYAVVLGFMSRWWAKASLSTCGRAPAKTDRAS